MRLAPSRCRCRLSSSFSSSPTHVRYAEHHTQLSNFRLGTTRPTTHSRLLQKAPRCSGNASRETHQAPLPRKLAHGGASPIWILSHSHSTNASRGTHHAPSARKLASTAYRDKSLSLSRSTNFSTVRYSPLLLPCSLSKLWSE